MSNPYKSDENPGDGTLRGFLPFVQGGYPLGWLPVPLSRSNHLQIKWDTIPAATETANVTRKSPIEVTPLRARIGMATHSV